MQGGMGVPEAVPFAEREVAERFARDRGGRVLAFDAIPDEAVLGAVGQTPGRPERAAPGSAARPSRENDVSGVSATRVAAYRVPKQGPEH